MSERTEANLGESREGSLKMEALQTSRQERLRALGRALRYILIRSLVILATVLVGIYLAIWVTNVGGIADEYRRQEVVGDIHFALGSVGISRFKMPYDEWEALVDELVTAEMERRDLGKPFVLRSFQYFVNAVALSLGDTIANDSSEPATVRAVLFSRLPLTLLLFGPASLLTFFGGLFLSLVLTRRYGSTLDRIAALLAPLFAAPPWFHGIFLIILFASIAKILPFGGIVDVPLPETPFAYAMDLLEHMILPVLALTLGTMPYAIYSNRALFLINSSEDYVEMAVAKGSSPRRLQRRYILRPVLPAIITNFAMITLVSWQGVVLTEFVFGWPGLGSLLRNSIEYFQVNIVIGAVTMLAYLLGFSVLFLDVLYVLADPRVALGKGAAS